MILHQCMEAAKRTCAHTCNAAGEKERETFRVLFALVLCCWRRARLGASDRGCLLRVIFTCLISKTTILDIVCKTRRRSDPSVCLKCEDKTVLSDLALITRSAC